MKLSTSGLVHQADEGDRKCLNSGLWHACAGPLVSLPTLGSLVVYFPQGHSEQVVATTNKEIDAHIPNYPNLPAQLICQLHNITTHADVETDEVYGQMTLQPLSLQEQKDAYLPVELGAPNRQPTNYFCKTLTASDTSTHGGFSVPRLAAEKVFPPLDFSQTPPCQEFIARDLHDVEWKFRHIFRGEPKRHLLTTGWSVFVSAKRLVAGDSVLFIWNEKNQLLLGIRRALRPQTVMPSSVLSSDSMHIGLLVAAAHARHTRLTFDRIGTENQHHHHQHLDHDHQLQHPHQPSMKERTMDVMSVVGALLFGMGCGALTAATKYLVWSLCVPNRFDDEEEEEEEVEFDEDLYNTKKIAQNGYVAVANDVVVDDQVHGGVGKEGE